MKQRLKAIFRKPVVFYPLLFAAFPILFLYAHNISETPASDIWLPLVISVAATLVLWAILNLILRSWVKAGFATAIFLVLFFVYGHLYDVLERVGFVPKHGYLIAGMLLVWGICVYFIGRAKRDFGITTRFFNITALVLIAINLFNIVSYQVKLAGLEEDTPDESTAQHTANATELGTLPDIYFIVLDEYAHPDTMTEYYNYDSSEFIDSLEDNGFFIAGGSETQTSLSPLIIAQILNLEYLDYEPWSESTYRKIAYSQAADFLRTQGYQYIVFGNNFANYTWEKYAKNYVDLYLGSYGYSNSSIVSEFVHILWNTTMLRPFYYRIFGIQYEHSYRSQTLYMLEKLKELPELEGPKFIFTHFICPHEPFVFGPEGDYIAPANWDNHEDKQFYLGQYIFISIQIEAVVEALLEKSEISPIIILQSDHGPRHGYPVGKDEWRKVFNAMYLPGMDTDVLYDDISPVNTFRLIFNQYFGADYPLLEDD